MPVLHELEGDGPPVERSEAAVAALTETFDEHRDHLSTYLTAVAGQFLLLLTAVRS